MSLFINLNCYFFAFQYPFIPFCDSHFHEVSDFYFSIFRDEYLLEVASSSHPCLIFSPSGYQDLLDSVYHEKIARLNRLTEDIVEDCPSSRLFSWRDIILESVGCRRAYTSRVASYERDIELALSHRGRRSLELLLRLPWESDDDICRDRE